MVWLIGIVVTGLVVVGGLGLHHVDEQIERSPSEQSVEHSPSEPDSLPGLPNRPLDLGEIHDVKETIKSVAESCPSIVAMHW